ncbi:DUF983 domain-containing protein [Roseibium salinum]|uniref:DUF983 domain-containing protein n=1 Tax=Roseibium salinum TaxID=1604349 RepID=A0ABT3R1K6_9HYPH|nr:DUF983 domain-containing protein [Roseibium sp. DSM 29163]MCX2723105.1 DUF983 domain-containing protein [Roseibium sp. DSM 29163]
MTVHYELNGTLESPPARSDKPRRPVMPAMLRGAANRCMNCGQGRIFDRFLKTNHACSHCGTEFHHHRADDAPPYFTITIVGHIVIPALLAVEVMWHPDLWIHMALWVPLTLVLSFLLMQPIKGALVGLQWALYMHGFDPDAEDDLPPVPLPSERTT